MNPRQTAVVEMVVLLVLLLMSWDATAATVKAAHDDEQMSLRPSRKEGRFLRVRASRPPMDLQLEFSPSKESSSFLSTNDEEVEEEGKRTEGLDWSALEAFHKDISSEQYTREGGMIWNQRTLIFISSSATTTSSSSSAPSSTTPNQQRASSGFLIHPDYRRVVGDDDRYQGDDGHSQDDDGLHHDDDRYQNDDDGRYDDDMVWRNRTEASEDVYDWEPPAEIEGDELWLECNRNRDGGGTVPPECEDLISSSTNEEIQHGGGSGMGAGGNADDTGNVSAVDNLVRMRIVVGMAQRSTNKIYMSHVISLAINQLLRTTTPFQAFYFGEESIQQLLLQQDHQRSLEHQRTHHTPSDHTVAYLSSYPAIQLLHAWTTMERLPLSMKDYPDIVLYEMRVDYGAFFEPQSELENPEPIRHPRQLGNITWLGQSYVDRDIENGVLVRQIELIIQDMLGQVQGHQDSSTTNPSNVTGLTNFTYWQEIKDNTDFACAAHIGEDGRPGIPSWTQAWMDRQDLRIVSSDPLTLEFGLREWFGVSIGGITLFVATFLFCTSSWYQRRQLEKEWKQVMLTEQGISDVLRVGWRYQTTTIRENDAQNSLSRQQLFLQIYEKPKFRGEENSILPGGVEREEMEHSSGNSSPTLKISESESGSSQGSKRLT